MRSRWIAVVALAAVAAAPETVVVKREGARVMKAPRFFGEACTVAVTVGQRVRLVEQRGSWARLASPGDGKCWLHESAWVDRKAGELVGNPATASQRDVELAGRGFSEAEEQRFRSDHPDLRPDFAIVEAYLLLSPETPPADLAKFVADGRLGGAK
jgi:hypothetical protein